MHIEHSPCITYDPWTVVLSCLERFDWLSVAQVSPALDDVVVYHALELGHAGPIDFLAPFPCDASIDPSVIAFVRLRLQIRWGLRVTLTESTLPVLRSVLALYRRLPGIDATLDINVLVTRTAPELLPELICDADVVRGVHLSLRHHASLSMGALEDVVAWGSCLQTLDVAGCGSNVRDEFVPVLAARCPNLTSLNVSDCHAVTDVNAIRTLRELLVLGFSGVGSAGIAKLYGLRRLDCSGNPRVTNVNTLTDLDELCARSACGVTTEGMLQLRSLRSLDVRNNKLITSVNHLLRLEVLLANNSALTDVIVAENLRVLHTNTPQIRCLRHVRALDTLVATGRECGVTSEEIQSLRQLRVLVVDDNPNVTTIRGLGSLSELSAEGSMCGVDDDGLVDAASLRVLNCSYNRKIGFVHHMSQLEVLHARGSCGVTGARLRLLRHNLRVLDADGNPEVDTMTT